MYSVGGYKVTKTMRGVRADLPVCVCQGVLIPTDPHSLEDPQAPTLASENMLAFCAWGEGRSRGALEGRIMPPLPEVQSISQ